MVRLAISVEGQTEEEFVRRLLEPHFLPYEIYTTPILLASHGGDVALPRIKKDLNKLASSFDHVTTLYDFYGFRGKAAEDTKESLEQKILQSVAKPLRGKVTPYIQMYEFEGLLFTSPEIMEDEIGKEGLANWANTVLKAYQQNPEAINDSPATAPSKRLEKQATYIKTQHGPTIATTIGLVALRSKCKGFNHWITHLETLR